MHILSLLTLATLLGLTSAVPAGAAAETSSKFLQASETLFSQTKLSASQPFWESFETETEDNSIASLLDAAYEAASDASVSSVEQLSLDDSIADWVAQKQANSEQYQVLVQDVIEAALEGANN